MADNFKQSFVERALPSDNEGSVASAAGCGAGSVPQNKIPPAEKARHGKLVRGRGSKK